MQLRHALSFVVLLLLLIPYSSSGAHHHNISRLLSKHPSLSTFNHYLTVTRLAAEINRLEGITVCAVDNAAMAALLSKNVTAGHVKKVLSLHVLLAYYDANMLHNIPSGLAIISSIYSGAGYSGSVQIVDYLDSDKVGFSLEDAPAPTATFVKSFVSLPYNFSLIQISALLPLPRPRPRS